MSPPKHQALLRLLAWSGLCAAPAAMAAEVGKLSPPGEAFDVIIATPDDAEDAAFKAGRLAALTITFTQHAGTKGTVPAISAVKFDAGMPGHGHGMTTSPTVTTLPPHSFRIDGVKLHMPGFWQLGVAFIVNGKGYTLSVPFERPL